MTLYSLSHLVAFSFPNAIPFGLFNFTLILKSAKPAPHPLLNHNHLVNVTLFQESRAHDCLSKHVRFYLAH